MTHAAAVSGVQVSPEEVRLARVVLTRLGLIVTPQERDRRPTAGELNALIDYFDTKPRRVIPMSRITRFAIVTAMPLEEICSITWDDIDVRNRIAAVKNRKDPRKKDGNHQRVPLLDPTGFDAWQAILEHRIVTRGVGKVFPHHHKSAGTAFHRSCEALRISDLHFHDLRHEGNQPVVRSRAHDREGGVGYTKHKTSWFYRYSSINNFDARTLWALNLCVNPSFVQSPPLMLMPIYRRHHPVLPASHRCIQTDVRKGSVQAFKYPDG